METNEQIEQKKRKKEILGRNCSQVRLREVTSLEQVVRRERMASLKDLLRSDCLDPITAGPDSSIRTPTEARRESDGYRRNNGAKSQFPLALMVLFPDMCRNGPDSVWALKMGRFYLI